MNEPLNGLDLAATLYKEAAKPLIERNFPDLAYAAALIGPGSEVLGFDDEMSRDHHWGPRFQLFLREEDLGRLKASLKEMLANELPLSIRGIPVNFTEPGADGSQMPEEIASGPVNHRIEITTAHLFMERLLGFDPRSKPSAADWLSFSSQTLLSLTSGGVFHDEIGLVTLRDNLAFYPNDVWLYMMAAGWQRISQEEHLIGRAGTAGDDLGSRIIAGRLVSDIMHLTFLQARKYAPYAKWFQRGFHDLEGADALLPHLEAALSATSWQPRLDALASASELVAKAHNALGVTPAISEARSNFHSRPFPVIHGERFVGPLVKAIESPELKTIAAKGLIGGVDQISDQTDFKHPQWRASIAAIYPGNQT